jgi:hypothetical protein
MAKPQIKELAERLVGCRFDFMSKGEHALEDIYRAVKAAYPQLCDDAYLCAENCASGLQQPEWRHAVRGVLTRLKRGGVVERGERRGRWRFT